MLHWWFLNEEVGNYEHFLPRLCAERVERGANLHTAHM